MSDEDRVNELEIKLAFMEKVVGDLSSALQQATQNEASLQERVEALERALKVLAARVPRPRDDVANAEEDPVPSSG